MQRIAMAFTAVYKSGNIISYVFILVLVSMYSCNTTKQSTYFSTLSKDTAISGFVNQEFESKIKKGDFLSINVTSLSTEEDILFNKAASNIGSAGGNGYFVKSDGTVLLHKLGNVTVEGLTRNELATNLQKALLPYMKEPIVNVGYLNHKVTVIGDVGNPGIVQMPGEQMPLLDVLVLSGDINENAKRDRIMIIRDNGNEKTVKYVNLEDHSIFSSPWYYSQPNDIVYVLKDSDKLEKEEKKRKLQSTMTLVASGITFVFLVIDRLTR